VLHRLVDDVLGDHRLPEPVRTDEDEVLPVAHEVEREGTLDLCSRERFGPRLVELAHGPERADAAPLAPALEAAPCAFTLLDVEHALDEGERRVSPFGSVGD